MTIPIKLKINSYTWQSGESWKSLVDIVTQGLGLVAPAEVSRAVTLEIKNEDGTMIVRNVNSTVGKSYPQNLNFVLPAVGGRIYELKDIEIQAEAAGNELVFEVGI